MKRGRLPLTALRSFEVAGRLRSFTLAAEELHISQAAVSRQVRELESLLGQSLFERRHRSVSVTPAGEHVLSVLTQAFDDIGASLDRIRSDKPPSTVIVSAEPSFASAWLVRNISRFRVERPDIDVMLDADPRLIDFRTTQATVAIRYSAENSTWPRLESRRLVQVTMVPVVAPNLIEERGALEHPSDVLQFPLLHEENRDLWQTWFAAAGVPAKIQRGTVYSDGGLVLQATIQGEGIALIDELFVKENLEEGNLIQPFNLSIPGGYYWLVTKKFAELSEAGAVFVRWLESMLRSGT